jgi:1-acyl-sn-glycerol-3-phosphate acyltransferase
MHLLLSSTLLVLLAPVYLAAFPFLTLAALLYDGVVDHRLPRVRALLLVGGLLIAELVGLLGAVITLRHRDPDAFETATYRLQRIWSRGILRWSVFLYDLRFELTGDALGDGPFLLLPRHASLADTLLPMWLTDGPTPLRPRYALKKELLWDPCLNVVGQRVPNVFVDRSAGSAAEIQRVADLAVDLPEDSFVVLFPEGTRFSESRRAKIIERLQLRGDDDRHAEAVRLKNVLPVRPGGTVGLMNHAGLDVVLMAHTGLEGTRSLGDVLRGDLIGSVLNVHLRRVPAHDLPTTDEGRLAWLREAWDWMDSAVTCLKRAA